MYDVIIIGAGPAGLCAAVYCRRAGKTTLVLEKGTFGGQITYSPMIENYPGYEAISGAALAEKLVEQALSQGAEIELAEVQSIKDGEYKTVHTDSGDFEGKAVIIATGAKHRRLCIEGEDRFLGNGISFCAVCDGAFYQGRDVAVIGGGNSALQEAILLANTSKSVTVVQNLAFLTGEKRLAEKLEGFENVKIICSSVVERYLGEDTLSGIRIKNTENGAETDISCDGVFIAIGLEPELCAFKDNITLDRYGYAIADEECTTKSKGIFVAGDCRSKKIRQITTATADGASAALAACRYIDG